MTAGVPDPQTCQALSQCVNALGRHDRRCPAAVPDPSFRDQLAEANGWSVAEVEDAILADLQPRLDESDAAWVVRTFVAPLARELARVQAAANQREAETLIQLADAWDENASRWYYEHRHTHPNGIGWVGGFEEGWGEGARLLRARAAALASPAPATQVEEGQR